ncbi:hypothetical protein Y032_0222g2630 [Ancylostoma ceylanicum]|nr:hypothetical protein Y032_0222g2630 [Ancylostoma ceylanicum]
MGQRLAPVLAICFMSKIEEPVLSRCPLMYCRYIDDCCIVTSTQSEMDECFRILNQQSQYIKLTRETPRDGWLAYLNIQLMLSNGVVRVKWYRKESSKNIIVHAASAHPTAVKRAVIRNMLKTATDVCSGEIERQESLKQAFDILHSNGYQTKPRKTRRLRNVSSTVERSDKLLLCLPFISDRISAAIRKCLIRAQLHDDVVLVNIPNDNIKRQLIRNRLYDRTCVVENCTICPYGKIGDCVKTGVIYEIECSVCHARYIGETGRPLYVRVNEHLASKKRESLITPLGKHRREVHGGNDFSVKCKILAYEASTSARKTLEAFYISARNPDMNGRNEHLAITNDLIPFLSLCERSVIVLAEYHHRYNRGARGYDMIKPCRGVLKDASKSTNTPVTAPRKRGRPRKREHSEVLSVINVKKELVDESYNLPPPVVRSRPRECVKKRRTVSSLSSTGNCTPSDRRSSAATSECSPGAASTNMSISTVDMKPSLSLSPLDTELVDVQELWDYYTARAEYQSLLSKSNPKYSRARGRTNERQAVVEKIQHLRRIEQSMRKGVKQITTFEFFNYVNPLCPGLNDVTTDVFIIACSKDKIVKKDFLSRIVIPCKAPQQRNPPVLYYSVPPEVEKSAVDVYLVVKVYTEQKYHYIGSARRIGRSRGEQEEDIKEAPVVKRVLYGVRKVASRVNEGIDPDFGNHTVVLVNNDTDGLEGITFRIPDEKWMTSSAQLDLLARTGTRLCSLGPIGLINFGISDEHVEYDWNVVEKVMDTRFKRKTELLRSSEFTVWYHYKGLNDTEETPATARESPSSDKENRSVRVSPRKSPRSPQKLTSRSLSPRKNGRTPVTASPDFTLPSGVLDRVPGFICPFTGKGFESVEELEEHLSSSYPAFKFEKAKWNASFVHFVVTSRITRSAWENPTKVAEERDRKSLSVISPRRKVLYAPPPVVPTRKKNELPKAQIIPYGEMSFVPPTYSQVPGPSSSKVYHSVIEDTCDWKDHLSERNIRDYIDDTPQEKEFMILHNKFRSKFRHLIVGSKLTLDFYTKFVEACGPEMKKKRIRAHCVARLTRLVQQEKMTPTNMAMLTQKLYELGPIE